MKVKLTVYYEDGSSGIIEIDKPAGAHPDSIVTAAEGLLVAERSGKRVTKIGRSEINPFSKLGRPLVIDDHLVTRQQVLEALKGTTEENGRYKSLYS